MEWYYADASEQQQAVDESQIPGLIAAGTIKRTTLVWNETLPDWKDAGQVRPDWFPASSPEAGSPVLAPVTTPGQYPSANFSAPEKSPADPLAICSLVFGVLGIMCLGPLLGIPGVICGHLARKKAARETTPSSNGGLALAGLITGYIGILIWVLYFGFAVVVAVMEEMN